MIKICLQRRVTAFTVERTKRNIESNEKQFYIQNSHVCALPTKPYVDTVCRFNIATKPSDNLLVSLENVKFVYGYLLHHLEEKKYLVKI